MPRKGSKLLDEPSMREKLNSMEEGELRAVTSKTEAEVPAILLQKVNLHGTTFQ